MFAPYQAIRCADGYITLGSANDRLFQRLCALLGHPEWATEPDYANATLRVRNRIALAERIESITVGTRANIGSRASTPRGSRAARSTTTREAFADPQIRAREMVVEIEHPTLGRVQTPGSPIKMSETPPVVARPAPLLGEHTREVLRRWGIRTRKSRP